MDGTGNKGLVDSYPQYPPLIHRKPGVIHTDGFCRVGELPAHALDMGGRGARETRVGGVGCGKAVETLKTDSPG
jgi:hypothetical protein